MRGNLGDRGEPLVCHLTLSSFRYSIPEPRASLHGPSTCVCLLCDLERLVLRALSIDSRSTEKSRKRTLVLTLPFSTLDGLEGSRESYLCVVTVPYSQILQNKRPYEVPLIFQPVSLIKATGNSKLAWSWKLLCSVISFQSVWSYSSGEERGIEGIKQDWFNPCHDT